jgi:hypothetical protein
MTKQFFLIAAFISFFLFSRAQFDTSFARVNIHHCADSLTKGFKTKDWELFTRYTYPALIGTLGGKANFIKYISQTFMQIPDSAWKKYEAGKVLQIVKAGKDLQTLIELNSIIEWQGRRITTTSHLIGESWDGGLFWTFFDSQNDAMAAKQINPNLSTALVIPKKNETVVMLPVLPASGKPKTAAKAKSKQ